MNILYLYYPFILLLIEMTNTQHFCNIVRTRSSENKKAINLLFQSKLSGQIMSVLRQELDSMVRVIFLLSQSLSERESLINQTISGQKWKLSNNAQVTDRKMVELADTLHGWAKSVYKFGCAFIHLSSFHDYNSNDPFENLQTDEIDTIKAHLNNYHGFPLSNDLNIESISYYLPMIFDKVNGNLEYYIAELEAGKIGLIY